VVLAAGLSNLAAAQDTSWVARSAIYEVFVQDFSPRGDLRGVTEGLDRIEATGANVVWLMPIHPVAVEKRKGTLGSRYATRDYYAIDPAYGTPQDFRDLIAAVHARGMKLILDWVPNHTGWDHVWTREHPDYYIRDDKGELSVPRGPDGNLTDWTDVAQLDYRNPELRRAMIAAMRHWLVEYDIDGFRVDVAGFVPYDFWREALPQLRAAVPKPILLLAEWADLEMHQVGFDLTYAWDSYSRLKEVWNGAAASRFVELELAELAKMPPGGMRLRFTTNHDETAWDNPPVVRFGGSAGARAAFVAMALLPGRPLLYNGQEVESPQKLGIFEKEAIVWDRPGGLEAREFYARLLQLSRTEPAILAGPVRAVITSVPNDVIAYTRGDLLVLVNARARAVEFTVHGLRVDGMRDLLSGRQQHGRRVSLAPYGAVVLRRSA
jgi:glycosidase